MYGNDEWGGASGATPRGDIPVYSIHEIWAYDVGRSVLLWRGRALSREHALERFQGTWRFESPPERDNEPHGLVPEGAPGIAIGPEGDPA